eukprot:5266255-Heterocapsa_arctica.AAC.2
MKLLSKTFMIFSSGNEVVPELLYPRIACLTELFILQLWKSKCGCSGEYRKKKLVVGQVRSNSSNL